MSQRKNQKKIKKHFEVSDNENPTYLIVWVMAKEVLRQH